MATRTGLPRTVRLWRRGTDPAQAPVLFETKEDYSAIWANVDRDAPEERIWFFEKPGLIDVNSWIGDRTGPKIKIELPADAAPDEFRGWLAVKLRAAWTTGGETFEPDSVIGISFDAFWPGTGGLQNSSSQQHGALCSGFSGLVTGWCYRFWIISSRCSKC